MRALGFFLVPTLLSSLVVACSPYALGEPKTPPIAAFGPAPSAELGTICVIRPSRAAVAVTFAVHDNHQLVGGTKGPSYFCYEVEPGEHVLVSDTFDTTDSAGEARIVTAAGTRYWVHQDYDNVLGSIHSKLSWIDEARARELIDGCDYVVITEVPGNERLPGDRPIAKAKHSGG